jgi:hypothetical protein
MLVLDRPSSLEQALSQRDALANALHRLGIGIGLLDASVACDGPTLLMATEGYADHALSDGMSHPVLQTALRSAYEASGDLENSTGRRSDPLYQVVEAVLLSGEDDPALIPDRLEALAETIGELRRRIEDAAPSAPRPGA